jgi:hypothetical protein
MVYPAPNESVTLTVNMWTNALPIADLLSSPPLLSVSIEPVKDNGKTKETVVNNSNTPAPTVRSSKPPQRGGFKSRGRGTSRGKSGNGRGNKSARGR